MCDVIVVYHIAKPDREHPQCSGHRRVFAVPAVVDATVPPQCNHRGGTSVAPVVDATVPPRCKHHGSTSFICYDGCSFRLMVSCTTECDINSAFY